MKRIGICALLVALFATAPAVAQPAQKIIFDTDFAFPPQDDAMALFFVHNSPELEILGITTVAGNRSRNVATADALKVLEQIPVEIMHGTRDRLLPPRHANRMAAELPSARLWMYPGAGHMLMQERPRDVTHRLTSLARKVRG